MSVNTITIVLEGDPLVFTKFDGVTTSTTPAADVVLRALDDIIDDHGYQLRGLVIAADCEKAITHVVTPEL